MAFGATNQNDVLHRLFGSGNINWEVSPSLAPSMDIQVASNFERLLFYFLDGNADRVREVIRHSGYWVGMSLKIFHSWIFKFLDHR